jgi:ABC-type glycerol-3-phosphate transport system substrate-binding protein
MKKNKMRYIIIISFVVLLLLSAAGCVNTPSEEANKKLTISVCWDFYELEAAIKKFNLIYPDVEIVLNKYNNEYEKYVQTVSTQLMSGSADDIIDATGLGGIKLL